MSIESRTILARGTVVELRLTGENVAPGAIRSKDLAQIIDATEDMIASIVVRDDPTLQKDEVIVGLLRLAEGSFSLQFATPLGTPVLLATDEIAASLRNDDYEELPISSVASLRTITTFSRKHNCNLELNRLDGQRTQLATITPETRIEPMRLVAGSSTIYGEVISAGGVEPAVKIRLPGGRLISCAVSLEIAKELGERLYAWVGLRGEGKWASKDLTLNDFAVEAIASYQDTPISEAMAELSTMLGRYFAEVEDVEQYVSELRGHYGQE